MESYEKMEQDMCEFKKYIKMTNDLLVDAYKWLRLSQYADDENSRSKLMINGGTGAYWLRSTYTDSSDVKRIANIGARPYHLNDPAYAGNDGIAPIIVLH